MPPIPITEFVAWDELGFAVDRLCFGRPVAEARTGSRTRAARQYRFRPGQVFAVIWHRWRKNGRQHRAIAIVETLANPSDGVCLPGISQPVRVHAMTDQHGPAGQGGGVDRWLLLIQSIQREGMDTSKVPTSYWRLASFQIMLQQRPSLPELPASRKRNPCERSKTWSKLEDQLDRGGRNGNGFYRGQSPDRNQHVPERSARGLSAFDGAATRGRDR